MEPKYVGWLSVENPWDRLNYQQKLRSSANRFQNGTTSYIGIYALNASMRFLEEFGFDKIERQVIENSLYFINELDKIGMNPLLKDCDEKYLAGITSFKHEKGEKIFKQLGEKNIRLSLREGIIRFSPHFYNTRDEIDIIINELKKVI